MCLNLLTEQRSICLHTNKLYSGDGQAFGSLILQGGIEPPFLVPAVAILSLLCFPINMPKGAIKEMQNITVKLSNIFDKMLSTVYYARTRNTGYGASERRS